MSSILISSQNFTNAGEIARRTADLLGYRHVDEEVFATTSTRFGVPIATLGETFERGPSIFGMSAATRKRHLAYVQATLSATLLDDGVVYGGPFAHALVTGVSHILRVRIVASATHRCGELMRVEGLPQKKAARWIAADDARIRQIAELLFGMDVTQQAYDMVVDAGQWDAVAAAATIADTAREKRYEPMSFSKKVMRSVELEHRLRAMLMDLDADATVEVVGDGVNVRAHASGSRRSKTEGAIEQRLRAVDGIEQVNVQVFDNDLTSAGRR